MYEQARRFVLERVGFITARGWRILPTAGAPNPLAIADRMLPDMVCAGAFMTCKCRVLKPVPVDVCLAVDEVPAAERLDAADGHVA